MEVPPPVTNQGYVTLGLLYDPAHSFNPLELGPPADSAEVCLSITNLRLRGELWCPEFLQASEFRKFWGECSELRRFADGSIHEAIVWNGEDTASCRRTVPEQIVRHLLAR